MKDMKGWIGRPAVFLSRWSPGSSDPGIVAPYMFFMCVMVPLVLFAQKPPEQAPVFRGRVEVVQLDVSVLDKQRQPVRGLTEKDFTVLEDGKPQRIVNFSTFDADSAQAPVTGWMRDVAPDVTTNELKDSRLFVLVMDDGLIPQEPFSIESSKTIARSIIEKLGPDDLTAVIFTGDNRKTQDFTNDKSKLLAAIDRFNPGLAGYRFGLDSANIDVDLWFYQAAVRTLGNIADYLIAVPGRRKALFWVSPGVPADLEPVVPRDPRDGSGDPMAVRTRGLLPPSDMVELLQRTDDVFRRAQRANVTVYPIDPTGLGGMREYLAARLGPFNRGFAIHKATVQQDYLASVAANTGGRAVMNTNDFGPGIAEAFAENQSYYLLAFEPTNAVTDGTLRHIEVKVNRSDVEVRTRSGYYAPEPEKPADRKSATNAMTPEAEALAKAMSGILPNAGLPMRAAVAPFVVPGQHLATVAIVLGVRQPVPAAAAKSRITETTELLTSAFTPSGDPKGTQRHTAKVVLRAGADGDAAYEVLARIDLPAGRYQLRLAAHNTTSGKDGSVFVDVTVPDYSNIPFSASPVVLSATPGRVAAPKDLLASLLPLVPTAEREFAASDAVTALLRLYQSGQKPIERVQVSIQIRDGQDALKVSETRTIGVDRFPAAAQQIGVAEPQSANRFLPPSGTRAPAADKFANLGLRTADVTYQVPLSTLAAGPYLLTFDATLGSTTVRRAVRFQVTK